MELLNFFEEALNVEFPDGSAVLENGSVVVMDNCGFHHGHLCEPILRDMLAEYGIRLLFQPPYSPHFNVCEFCFAQVKSWLRKHDILADRETLIAIGMAINNITKENLVSYFRHCGYL